MCAGKQELFNDINKSSFKKEFTLLNLSYLLLKPETVEIKWLFFHLEFVVLFFLTVAYELLNL